MIYLAAVFVLAVVGAVVWFLCEAAKLMREIEETWR